ncbi:hypothetical protein [Streptomyces sp. NPDC051546]|uniref:hypothetical protein n=1 Tax=Streptomyces sp. NPDC051546 TaxID=3365655 RepID=UPI0037B08CC6
MLRLTEYLASRQTNLLAAGAVDLLAYRRQRLDVQAVPIDAVTWDRETLTVNGLFAWLTETGHRSNGPLRMPKAYGSGGPGVLRQRPRWGRGPGLAGEH